MPMFNGPPDHCSVPSPWTSIHGPFDNYIRKDLRPPQLHSPDHMHLKLFSTTLFRASCSSGVNGQQEVENSVSRANAIKRFMVRDFLSGFLSRFPHQGRRKRPSECET